MERRYNAFSAYLRQRFGCRVQKISIDAGFSCPNRDGTLSSKGCLYCDGKGSGTGAAKRGESIAVQVQKGKRRLAGRYNAKRFIAYFQAFTNTYAPCHVLKKRYDEALKDPDMVGLAIGTRPDCIDEEKLTLIESYAAAKMVWIEYGLQSIHNRTLQTINRGHTFEDFVRGVEMTRGRKIMMCAHVILGLPGESKQDVVETAAAIGDMGIEGVKIHSLYLLKNTPLASLYRKGGLQIIDEQTYVDWVIAFLESLPPHVIIQRLTGDPDPGNLLAPSWTLRKQHVHSLIQQTLGERKSCQGRRHPPCRGRVPG